MWRIALSCFLLASPFTLRAQTAAPPSSGAAPSGTQGQAGPPRHGPPPEAIAACQGKSAGAACSFTGREGRALTGTCFVPPPRPQGGMAQQGSGAQQGGGGLQGGGGQQGQAPQGPSPQGNAPSPGKGMQGTMPMACRPAGMGPGGPQGGQGGQGRGPGFAPG